MGRVNRLIDRIETEVQDVLQTEFEYSQASYVPNSEDGGLTFGEGEIKKGKELDTCVLFTDIRDSVALTEKHTTKTMGRLYTAFSKSVLRIAEHHGGHVRNIIGDRVMVVFPQEMCHKNAVDCAVSINHVSSKIIAKRFNVDFECGIGIDYGKMRVIKVGVKKKGNERNENKNLVWVGYPANVASRLTDNAKKTISKEYFEVMRYPRNPRSQMFSVAGVLNPDKFGYDPNAPLYLDSPDTIEMSKDEFTDSISHYEDGTLYMKYGKNKSFEKKSRTFTYNPILITEEVFKGLKKEEPDRNSIKKELWKEEVQEIENVKGKVFGADLIWILDE